MTYCNNENIYNSTKNIKGKDYDIIRNHYYNDYYTKYNDVYITDFKDENGNFCFRRIDIVPKCTLKWGSEYLGSRSEVKDNNKGNIR